MKPELTTSANELIKRVESKLSIPFSDDWSLYFSIFPSLGTDHFSIQLIEEVIPFLIARQWKWDQDTSYPLGIHIYDLNSIHIVERKIPLSSSDYSLISEIKTTDIRTKELNGIVLDGEYFHLMIEGKEYHWRMRYQISKELSDLLNKLIELAGFSR